MVLGRIDVQNEESRSLDSLAKILRRIAPQDDIVLLTNILTKGDNLNRNLQYQFLRRLSSKAPFKGGGAT